MRSDADVVDRGDHQHAIAHLAGVATVAPDNAQHLEPAQLGLLQSGDDVRADIALQIPAADRQHQHRVRTVGPADLEPAGKDRVPSLVVGSGREFGDVVGRRIGLDAAKLAKIIDRMAAIARTASHAQKEQPAMALAQGGQLAGHLLDHRRIDQSGDLNQFLKVRLSVHDRLMPVDGE